MFAINYDQSVISEYFGSDKVFVVGGMSFMYIFKSKDPRCKSWTTPMDSSRQFGRFFLYVGWDWNKFSHIPKCLKSIIY